MDLLISQVDSIGDAYVVVCLGDSDDLPPSRGAKMQLLSLALEMQQAVARIDGGRGRLRVRVGLAEGNVVAGLTGQRRCVRPRPSTSPRLKPNPSGRGRGVGRARRDGALRPKNRAAG